MINSSSVAFGGNAEYVVSQNTLQAADVNGSAQGTDLIITNPAVDNLSLTDNYSNVAPYTTMVRESSDFTAMKFSVRANNVRDLVLNGFTIMPNFDNPTTAAVPANIPGVTTAALGANNPDNSMGYVGDVMVYVDGNLVQTLTLPAAVTTSVTFNSLGIIIPK